MDIRSIVKLKKLVAKHVHPCVSVDSGQTYNDSDQDVHLTCSKHGRFSLALRSVKSGVSCLACAASTFDNKGIVK